MNNKGQTLVIFILFLPIIILLISIVVDLGFLQLNKNKTENDIKNSLEYGLNHINEPDIQTKLQNILNTNINGKTTITINNNTITITNKDSYKSIFNNIFKNKYNISITYHGYIENDKKIITKE